jgi:hypothetical protein
MSLAAFVVWLIVLVAGRPPDNLYQAMAAVVRFAARVNGYFFMLTSTYPGGLFGDSGGPADVGPGGVAAVGGPDPYGSTSAFSYGPPTTSYPAAPSFPADPTSYPPPSAPGAPAYPPPPATPTYPPADPTGYPPPSTPGAPAYPPPAAPSYPPPATPTYPGPADAGSPPPGAYSAPPTYPPPGVFPAGGYGYPPPAPYGAPPVWYPPTFGADLANWRLLLTRAARRVVIVFVALGVVVLIAYIAIPITLGARSVANANRAINEVNAAYTTLEGQVRAFDQAATACPSGPTHFSCAQQQDAVAAGDLDQFATSVSAVTVPAAAQGAQQQLVVTTQNAANDMRTLSTAPNVTVYQSELAGLDTQLIQLDTDYRALISAIQATV